MKERNQGLNVYIVVFARIVMYLAALRGSCLNGWAFNRTICTENAAVTLEWSQENTTKGALVIPLAGIGWHSFSPRPSTAWTCDCRFRQKIRHGSVPHSMVWPYT